MLKTQYTWFSGQRETTPERRRSHHYTYPVVASPCNRTNLLSMTCLLVQQKHGCWGGGEQLLSDWMVCQLRRILLPLRAECWNYRCVTLCSTDLTLSGVGRVRHGENKEMWKLRKKSTINECFPKKPEKTEESEQGADQSIVPSSLRRLQVHWGPQPGCGMAYFLAPQSPSQLHHQQSREESHN